MTDEMKQIIKNFMENTKNCIDLLDSSYFIRESTEYYLLKESIKSFEGLFDNE